MASSKVNSSKVEKHLCRVCSKPFLTISSRNKHERVNRKCSEVSIVEVGGADYGHDEGEGVGVEFTLNNIGKQCNFCQHKFTTVFCVKQHLCLLSPSFGPEYTVLQLVEEDVAGELKRQSWRLVTFETQLTILTIENLNSWQSLLPDN